MDSDAVTRSYARWAPIYDRTFGAATARARRATVRRLNGLNATTILEVGVGTGLALPFYDERVRVTGVDFSADMLAKARARVARQGLSHVAALREMDARALDFSDDSFDAVAAMHMISVVPEPERVMAEMVRVLRPGGYLAVTNHFARQSGTLARIEKAVAPFADLLGWHSDFPLATVTGVPRLEVVEQSAAPPMGMMTLLLLRKHPAAAA